MSESESSSVLSTGCTVSEEPVANIKEESKVDKDSEEIESDSEEGRLVYYFFICNQH
jgi:hypothetical protein